MTTTEAPQTDDTTTEAGQTRQDEEHLLAALTIGTTKPKSYDCGALDITDWDIDYKIGDDGACCPPHVCAMLLSATAGYAVANGIPWELVLTMADQDIIAKLHERIRTEQQIKRAMRGPLTGLVEALRNATNVTVVEVRSPAPEGEPKPAAEQAGEETRSDG